MYSAFAAVIKLDGCVRRLQLWNSEVQPNIYVIKLIIYPDDHVLLTGG